MKEHWRGNGDLILKALGVAAALFGIWQYFSETAESRRLEARRQALNYIEVYGAADLRDHRQNMFEFWLRHSDVVAVMRREGVSENAYRSFLSWPCRTNRQDRC